MPGMGEVLAGHALQEDAVIHETRDHRPLLHVPFLPVAEPPGKERRIMRRKLFILGVILFVVLDAVVLIWFFSAPRGALSGSGGESGSSSTPPAATPPGGSEASNSTSPPSGVPTIGAPSDFPTTPSGTAPDAGAPKPTKPPMAIPLPGHVATDVPTATPVGPAKAPEAAPPPAPAPSPAPAPAPPSAAAGSDAPPTGSGKAGSDPPDMPPVAPPPATAPPAAPAPSPVPAPGLGTHDTTSSPAATQKKAPSPPTAETPDPLPLPTFDMPGGGAPLPTPQLGALPSISPVPIPNSPPPAAPPAPLSMSGGEAPPVTPAPAPSGDAPHVGKVPAEAESALVAVQKFLAAANWQERAAFSQKGDKLKAEMEQHAAAYPDGPIHAENIAFLDRYVAKDGHPPYCMFEVAGGSLKHPVMVLVEQPPKGPARVDWETFVEFKDDLLLKFLTTQGAPNRVFRVLLRRKHYFDDDVPDLDGKDAFQIQQPNADFDGHVFTPKGGAASKQLAGQLDWGKDVLVMIELTWRSAGDRHWVEIARIVTYGWRN